MIPHPKSLFLQVQCPECGNKQIVYSHTTLKVKCRICGSILAENTGGKAIIQGTIVKKLD